MTDSVFLISKWEEGSGGEVTVKGCGAAAQASVLDLLARWSLWQSGLWLYGLSWEALQTGRIRLAWPERVY